MKVYPELATDAYKLGHREQYPTGTEYLQSNFTARSSRVPGQNEIVMIGLQAFLQDHMTNDWHNEFFRVPFDVIARRYKRRVQGYLNTPEVTTDHLRDLHKLGYIPLEVKAIPEGSLVPLGVPMMLLENTDRKFAWMVNYPETVMSSTIWKPITSATTALQFRRMLEAYAKRTGAPLDFVDWQAHDFSFRGMSGISDAAMSGLGHLVFFRGTDTLPAVDCAEEFYGQGLPENYCIGGSVHATEHSVMCAGTAVEGEFNTIKRIIGNYKNGIVSVVSDTYDLWQVLTKYLPLMKQDIMARDGKVVIRPDSGNPTDILCGDPDIDVNEPAGRGVVELLDETFGHTFSESNHKMLDAHVGAIYGDSITLERGRNILERLCDKGYASSNVVFGLGSFTYQYTTRDTYGMAVKATWAQVAGKEVDLFKDPITDSGMKKSAKGRLAVTRINGKLVLQQMATKEQEAASELKTVWKDSQFTRRYNFQEIRERAFRESGVGIR